MDGRIGAIAERQKGQIATRQLRKLGLSAKQINYRVRAGLLQCLDRGVYAVAYLPSDPDALWMTKLLRVGPESVLSHRTAAALWRIRPSAARTVDLTYPRRHRAVPGVRFHTTSLPPDEVTARDGLRATTVPRTLFDLAALLSEAELASAINEAEALELRDALSLPSLLARYPRRRGVAKLRRILARNDGGVTVSRSVFEREFLTVVAENDLPPPTANLTIEARGERFECDLVWPGRRLIVELDSRTWHRGWNAQQEDRRRGRVLSAAGWTVVRVSYEQFDTDRAEVLADLRTLIYTHAPRRRSSVGRALHS